MFTMGITGGSGSGKTSALLALNKLGALVIDCDTVYHELLAENAEIKSELAARFDGVLQNGAIDRKRLGEIVFKNKASLNDLNAITHKYVGAEIERRLAEWAVKGGAVAAIDAILLIESSRSKKCDVTVGIIAPVETRIARITSRDGITRAQAEMRINAQKPDSFFIENCDHILENTYASPEEFENKCEDFFAQLIGGHIDA